MNNSNSQKRLAIGIAIGWIVFVALMYIGAMLVTIFYPTFYLSFISNGTLFFAAMFATCVLSVIVMLIIHLLSRKSGIMWLKIISLVLLGNNAVIAIVALIQILLDV